MANINILLTGNGEAFDSLLQMLMSTQNDQRSQAEQLFAELKGHADACASHLIRSLKTSPSVESRALCAVLLRKVGVVILACMAFFILTYVYTCHRP